MISKFIYTTSPEKCALWTPPMVKVESLLQRGQSTGQNPSIGGTRKFLSDFYVGMCLWYLAEAEVRGCLHKKPTTNSLKSQQRRPASRRRERNFATMFTPVGDWNSRSLSWKPLCITTWDKKKNITISEVSYLLGDGRLIFFMQNTNRRPSLGR